MIDTPSSAPEPTPPPSSDEVVKDEQSLSSEKITEFVDNFKRLPNALERGKTVDRVVALGNADLIKKVLDAYRSQNFTSRREQVSQNLHVQKLNDAYTRLTLDSLKQ